MIVYNEKIVYLRKYFSDYGAGLGENLKDLRKVNNSKTLNTE